MEEKFQMQSKVSIYSEEDLRFQGNILHFKYYWFFIKLKKFRIKLLSWEYWPMWIVYFPSAFYYFFLSLKSRSFFFFSASNPGIENGGMFYESKWKIFELIPKQYFPSTILIREATTLDEIQKKIKSAQLVFPMVAKPDVGGRGFGVQKLHNENDLLNYRNKVKVDFLIQQWIDLPYECSVFYSRYPDKKDGEIISFTEKKLLSIIGDGKSNVRELIFKNDRAFLQFDKLKTKLNLTEVLKFGEEKMLVPYGNHILGAMFINAEEKISSELIQTFNNISNQIQGFYFGRFDIRCTNFDDLQAGKNIAILELNGAGAEPAHIYHPGFSFFKAQLVLKDYFKRMQQISEINHFNGAVYLKYAEFKRARKEEKKYKSKIAC